MSAIGYFCSVEKVKGKEGEDRVVIIMNGKFLNYTEQVPVDFLSIETFGVFSWSLITVHDLGWHIDPSLY